MENKEDKIEELNNKKQDIKKTIFEYLRVIVITFVVTFLILQIIQVSRVYGTSMVPTYHEGNIVIVDKTFYHTPKYNDIVIVDYKNSADETYIIKRVIGVGGDHIVIKDNKLYRNDKLVKENYINEPMSTLNLDVTVDKGDIFVMGDNRNVSLDSRKLGCFNFSKDVIGKVIFKVPFF
ncbi:MAG: signal peptidase I [Thomasclavelia sp.]|nr:signal peptidase I [Thomasclavelia sp.]